MAPLSTSQQPNFQTLLAPAVDAGVLVHLPLLLEDEHVAVAAVNAAQLDVRAVDGPVDRHGRDRVARAHVVGQAALDAVCVGVRRGEVTRLVRRQGKPSCALCPALHPPPLQHLTCQGLLDGQHDALAQTRLLQTHVRERKGQCRVVDLFTERGGDLREGGRPSDRCSATLCAPWSTLRSPNPQSAYGAEPNPFQTGPRTPTSRVVGTPLSLKFFKLKAAAAVEAMVSSATNGTSNDYLLQ